MGMAGRERVADSHLWMSNVPQPAQEGEGDRSGRTGVDVLEVSSSATGGGPRNNRAKALLRCRASSLGIKRKNNTIRPPAMINGHWAEATLLPR